MHLLIVLLLLILLLLLLFLLFGVGISIPVLCDLDKKNMKEKKELQKQCQKVFDAQYFVRVTE